MTVCAVTGAAPAMAALIVFALGGAGCSARNGGAPEPAAPPSQSAGAPSDSGQGGVSASIQISYEQANDTLQSVTVSQFTGARVLLTRNAGAKDSYSVVRFDGGVPVWQLHADRSILNPLSKFETQAYHLEKVGYGKLPDGFSQDIPDFGPPAPLEPGSYYIFKIERSSGAVSYEAVKVNADTSLQVYEAEPRAGASFKLCCNLAPDFAEPTPSELEDGP